MTDNDKPNVPAPQRDTTAEQKMLQALIDAAAVNDPRVKQRVTVAAAWQYLRLPDSSFGWVPRTNPGDPPPPMPPQCKAICVITTLSLGLIPGLGNVLWLGNKCFIDVYGKRTLAHREPGFAMLDRKLRPLTAEEREMFGLRDGDMALVLEQEFARGGAKIHGVGYGIIDSNEFATGKKPGLQTRKDAAMTLITRAERDFYNRYFPIDGLADMPEDPRAYAEQLETAAPPVLSPDATTVVEVLAEAPEKTKALRTPPEETEYVQARGNLRREAAARFMGLWERVAKLDADVDTLLDFDVGTVTKSWVDSASADTLNDAGDVLEAWLAERETPPPAGKKRGRKSNAEKAAMQAEASAAALAPAQPAPEVSTASNASPAVEASVARAIAGLPPPERFGQAFIDGIEDVAPFPASLEAPRKNAAEVELDARDRAEARCRAALDRVAEQGGAPMKILGFNPHNRLDDPRASSHELDAAADLLEKWRPGVPSAVEKNTAAGSARVSMPKPPATDAPPPDDRDAPPAIRPASAPAPQPQGAMAARPAPSAPRQSPGEFPAAGMLQRIIERHASGIASDKLSDATLARVRDLTVRQLRADDHLRLPKAFRESKAGNHRGLDELIADRAMLK